MLVGEEPDQAILAPNAHWKAVQPVERAENLSLAFLQCRGLDECSKLSNYGTNWFEGPLAFRGVLLVGETEPPCDFRWEQGSILWCSPPHLPPVFCKLKRADGIKEKDD